MHTRGEEVREHGVRIAHDDPCRLGVWCDRVQAREHVLPREVVLDPPLAKLAMVFVVTSKFGVVQVHF